MDGYPTATSSLQSVTENVLKAHLPSSETYQAAGATGDSSGKAGTSETGPLLQKQLHIQFLLRNLLQGFPERYISQDASQPWLIYWTLQGFSVLGIGMDDQTRKRAKQTLLALQHPYGGFSGGPGQAAHLLPTYAAVCALAIVGQPGPDGAWDEIDRTKMYEFFLSLKQPDGSYTVTQDGEVDVRGLYCLLSTATLLNIVTPELLKGMPEFIVSCQSYEGGFGNASFPEWAFPEEDDGAFDASAPRPLLGEAHGGYTFCATATWVLLQPYLRHYYSSSSTSQRPTVNMHALLRWLTQMQGTHMELGGFRGRTNKLVDGCYSWWVGGCVGLVEGLLGPGCVPGAHEPGAHAEEWTDIDDSLFNRQALQEYILYAGQYPAGGLRDKPPKSADSYHTLYCLSGLSAAQHTVLPDDARRAELLASWSDETINEREGFGFTPASDAARSQWDAMRKEAFVSALSWVEEEGTSKYVGGAVNRVNATHPLFNLTATHTEGMMQHFYGQQVPERRPKHPAAEK
ncbi:Protein farnesyltransferase subunit beta [Sparassis crispa]|uniref:Protein farnesyltransferase subunit beta n=1 Tax=Sparassis crispa TaxID=139825 RepID=A0A401GUQ7_9APHY|nr:Protein farnesyltransferase subunit beta [Sparassis crispa]GBE85920.1 Protein farnesyltransferase subunit beta [Sparassis crispa]